MLDWQNASPIDAPPQSPLFHYRTNSHDWLVATIQLMVPVQEYESANADRDTHPSLKASLNSDTIVHVHFYPPFYPVA
jgi:hypothetical protein